MLVMYDLPENRDQYPSPPRILGQETTDDRSYDRTKQRAQRKDGSCHSSLVGFKQVGYYTTSN